MIPPSSIKTAGQIASFVIAQSVLEDELPLKYAKKCDQKYVKAEALLEEINRIDDYDQTLHNDKRANEKRRLNAVLCQLDILRKSLGGK